MFRQMIFLVLALLIAGLMEGKSMENVALLPSEKVSDEDTIPYISVISLRDGWADFRQTTIPKTLSERWKRAGNIIDHHVRGPGYVNVFEMIQGRVPGVWVSGSFYNYRLRIRGAMNPPLVVVDGMPFYGYDDGMVNDLLVSIPPADVDYIEVLKNIAQTALYGPGAGNGVIIVHTKRGAL